MSKSLHKTGSPGVFFYESGRKYFQGKSDRCYYINYRNSSGRQTNEKIGWTSEGYSVKFAAQVRAERVVQIRHGDLLPRKKGPTLRFGEIAEKYFESKIAVLKGYSKDLNRYQVHLKGFHTLTREDLTPLLVEKIRKDVVAKGKQDSLHNILELFRRIVNYGIKMGYWAQIDFVIELPRRNNLKTEVLSPEQWQRFWQACDRYPNQHVVCAVRLAAMTGMRKSEIFNLRWDDIDLRTLHIIIRDPKSGVDERIPITEDVGKMLSKIPRSDNPFVFPGRDNEPIAFTRVATWIKREARLPSDFRPWHGLRHAFASALAETGEVDLYFIQRLLRHRSSQMTQRYAHLRDDSLRKASDSLKKAWSVINEQ